MIGAGRGGGARSIVLSAGALVTLLALPVDAQVGRSGETTPGFLDQAGLRARLEADLASDPRDVDAWVALARLELFSGDTARAELVLRTGVFEVTDSPRADDLRAGLLELLAVSARWSAADSVVKGIGYPARGPAELRPLAARVRFNVGVGARTAGDEAGALEAWEGASEIDPTLREAWLETARLQLATADTAAAVGTLRAALDHHPDDAELRLLEAATFSGAARATAEVNALRTLRTERPGDESVGLALADALGRGLHLDAALALYDSLTGSPGAGPATFGQSGRFWLRYGRADSALVILERGAEVHPDDVALAVLVGAAAERVEPSDGTRAGTAYLTAAERLTAVTDGSVDDTWLRIRAALASVNATESAAAVARALGPLSDRPLPMEAALLASEAAAQVGAEELALALLGAVGDGGRELPLRERAAELGRETTEETWRALALEGSALAALELGGAASVAEARAGLRGGIDRIGRWEEGSTGSGGEAILLEVDPAAIVRGEDLRVRNARDLAEGERARVERLLTSLVQTTAWGPSELARLRTMYPRSPLIGQVAARSALEAGDLSTAAREVARLLDRYPREAELHLLKASICEAREDVAGADAAWVRALELDAESEAAFEGLVGLRQGEGQLEVLLRRVRRLRRVQPEEARRWSHEVEVLHRLGRLEEASAVADSARAATGSAAGRGEGV